MQSQCTTRVNLILLTCVCQSHAEMHCKYLYTRALFQIWKQLKSLSTFLFQNGYLPLRAESEFTWLCFQNRDSRMSYSHVYSNLLWVELLRKPLHWGGAVFRGGTKATNFAKASGFRHFVLKIWRFFSESLFFPNGHGVFACECLYNTNHLNTNHLFGNPQFLGVVSNQSTNGRRLWFCDESHSEQIIIRWFWEVEQVLRIKRIETNFAAVTRG